MVWMLLAGLLMAQDAAPHEEAALDEEIALPQAPIDEGEAVALDGMSKTQYRWLKPRRNRMPANPYQQVDFTAYTLEWGEAKVGLAGIRLGVLPRVQLGTQPILDLVGIYNGNAKINVVRAGPLDLGVAAAYHELPLGDFKGQYGSVGGTASWIINPSWSIHGGASFARVQLHGVPNQPPALFRAYVDQAMIDEWAQEAHAVGVDPFFRAQAIMVKAAMDFRFNRRDSIVVQAQALTYGRVIANLGDSGMSAMIEDQVSTLVPGMGGGFLDEDKRFNVTDAYVVSVSYQLSWRRWDFRVGGGSSPQPLAWTLQANDVSYRFGGRTRRTEAKSKKGWRRNKGDVTRKKDTEPAS